MSGQITAISVQKRNPQRVNIYLDGEFAFGLARITAAWLSLGQQLSDEKIAQLQSEDARETAHQRALNLLGYRPRSEAEIRQNLQKNDFAPDVIEPVLERLRSSGLVDDTHFAEQWIENRTAFRPRGKRALAIEMRQRGLNSATIAQALESIDEEQETNMAYLAAQKKAPKLAGQDWPEFRNKLAAFLARRGFSYDVISPVVKKVWQDINRTGEINE